MLRAIATRTVVLADVRFKLQFMRFLLKSSLVGTPQQIFIISMNSFLQKYCPARSFYITTQTIIYSQSYTTRTQ